MSFLRKLFTDDRERIWRGLAADLDGRYVDGGIWKGDKVRIEAGEWTVTLDTYTVSSGNSHVTYTRLRAPYVNRDGFRFTVYRRNLFTDLGRFLGMRDIEIGDREFDEAFVLKGNDPRSVKRLFRHERIRELLLDQPQVHFSVKDDEGWFGAKFPEGVDELCFCAVGVITDRDRLAALFELFAETLTALCALGSAYEKDPGLEL